MSALHPVFTPTAVEPAVLDELTVGRVELLARVVDRIRLAARTGTRAHTLVVGPRGSGKTHLMAVALHRALGDPAVASELAVAWIPEDALAIGSYTDLLVELVRQLDPSSEQRAREARRQRDNGALERLLTEIADTRSLVLVVENLDRVFAGLGTSGTSGWRGFVETDARTLVLASAPLLFEGVRSRDEPWYGSFDIETLDDLDLAEGTEVLRRRAVGRDDDELADFVGTERGQARLKVVERLAGGSPRLWHILAEAVDVSSLDALLPAVEKLMDDLAPYYQQRLWELPPGEQKLVVELSRKPGMQTVAELAAETGASERATSVTLGRLVDSRWVRKQKAESGDQRQTWYELREPLLRHHLQFRESRGEPLKLIVEILRLWFSPPERLAYLAASPPGSRAERAVALTFAEGVQRSSDNAWINHDLDAIATEARCWRQGVGNAPLVGSPELGAAVEWLVRVAEDPASEVPGAIRAAAGPDLSAHLSRIAEQAGAAGESAPADRLAAELSALVDLHWPRLDLVVLDTARALWAGSQQPASAADQLSAVVASGIDARGDLALLLRNYEARFRYRAGDLAAAEGLASALLDDVTAIRGPDHPDTLVVRDDVAFFLGALGDDAGARDRYAALVVDRTRVLGADHPDTLQSRRRQAFSTGEAGDPAAARDQFAALVDDRTRILGPDDPDVLEETYWLASWTGRAGDPAGARDLLTELARDRSSVLGPEHEATLDTRDYLAHWTGHAGDFSAASDQYVALLADRTRVLGPDHPDTLQTRADLAFSTGMAGDDRRARDQYANLVADCLRILGPDRRITLSARAGVAFCTLMIDGEQAARDLYASVLSDSTRALGADDPDTREARSWLAEIEDHLSPRVRRRSLALSPEATRDLLQHYDSDTHRSRVLAMELLSDCGPLQRTEWLTQFGEAEDWAWDLAKALDGDATARLRLSPELRELVGAQSVPSGLARRLRRTRG